MTPEQWNAAIAESSAVRDGLRVMTVGASYPGENAPRPSSHFPLPLYARIAPEVPESLRSLRTIIFLPLNADGRERADKALEALQTAHLDFAALRSKWTKVTVDISRPGEAPSAISAVTGHPQTPLAHWIETASSHDGELTDLARAAELEMGDDPCIGMAVRWPLRGEAAGKLYCYLPSTVASPIGVDLQADFQLGLDRKHLDLTPQEHVGRYNRALIGRLSEVHLAMVLTNLDLDLPIEWRWIDPHELEHLRRGERRDDVWSFLDPGHNLRNTWSTTAGELRRALACDLSNLLFGRRASPEPWHADYYQPATWATWVKMAGAYFDGTARPISAYHAFWQATVNWIRARWKGSRFADPRRIVRMLLPLLREGDAHVIPILSDGEETTAVGVRPPAFGARTLFQRTSQRVSLAVPSALSELDVTSWEVPDQILRPDGSAVLHFANPFERAPLLQRLRQLPRAMEGWKPTVEDSLSAEDQVDLVAFAARLYALEVGRKDQLRSYARETGGVNRVGWRAIEEDDRRNAGLAVATLFLRCTDGLWRPARQCRLAEIDPSFKTDVANKADIPSDEHWSAFLTFIGVCTWNSGLLLVEGGRAGLVSGRAAPPPLIPIKPGKQRRALKLQLVPAETDPAFAMADILSAWSENWLLPLLSHELAGRVAVRASLADSAWVPVARDGGGVALAPMEESDPPSYMRPDNLILISKGDPRITQVTWRIRPDDEPLRALLSTLGARSLDRLLGEPARVARLLETLRLGFEDPTAAGPSVRLALYELHNRALISYAVAVGPETDQPTWDDSLKVLAWDPVEEGVPTSERKLAWYAPDEVWVARDTSDRSNIKWLFHTLPLMTAPVGPKQADHTPLRQRLLDLRSAIVPKASGEENEHTIALKRQCWEVLPKLLALAEVSRNYVGVVDAEDVMRRWQNTTFFQVEDVWQEWKIKGHSEWGTATPRKDKYDDVLYELQRTDGDVIGGTLYYDVDPREDRVWPPLSHFDASLSDALLNRTAEADWRAALSVVVPGAEAQPRLDAYLERRGVERALWEKYKRLLAPLEAGRLQALARAVQRALQDVDVELKEPIVDFLKVRCLLTEHFVRFEASCKESDLRAALAEMRLEADLVPYRPTFRCRTPNLASFEAWLDEDHRKERLLAHVHSARFDTEPPTGTPLLRGPLASELQTHARARASYLNFDCERVARTWADLPLEGELDLPRWIAFQKVESVTIPKKFETVKRIVDSASTVEHGAYDADKEIDRQTRMAARGGDAEYRIAELALRETQDLLDRDPETGWRSLRSALIAGGKVHEAFVHAEAAGGLTLELLHISKRWNSAGFDVLGLERAGDGVQPVRYEVKAIGAATGLVRFFLSPNEFGTLQAVEDPGRGGRFASGSWKLVGVASDGGAPDLTPHVRRLLALPARRALADEGVRLTGIEVTVRIVAP
jgi:hypothetical protein